MRKDYTSGSPMMPQDPQKKPSIGTRLFNMVTAPLRWLMSLINDSSASGNGFDDSRHDSDVSRFPKDLKDNNKTHESLTDNGVSVSGSKLDGPKHGSDVSSHAMNTDNARSHSALVNTSGDLGNVYGEESP